MGRDEDQPRRRGRGPHYVEVVGSVFRFVHCKRVAEAGWQPITLARSSDPKVYVERFGHELLTVFKDKNAFRLSLTDQGTDLANTVANDDSYASLVEQMKRVKKTLGGKAGSTLKKLVYQVFEKEVAERRMGETIE